MSTLVGRRPCLPATSALALVFLSWTALPVLLFADHGPGTTGGSSTQSGETLKPGAVVLGARWDFTQFETLNSSEIARKAAKVDGDEPHFDTVRWSLITTFELAIGVLEDFQLSMSTGIYRGDDVREGHLEDTGEAEVHDHGDVSGITDLWLNGKYRFLKGPYGHWAALAGIKFPTGRDDVRGDNEEILEPSLQPGSGAFDFLAGAAYSVWLAERLSLDASASYTFRTENDDFKIGDRVDAGAALTFRITEDVKDFPQWAVFVEPSVRHQLKTREDSHAVENTGGTTIFNSPGVRVGITERVAFTLAAQVPVAQFLNDEQQETLIKVLGGLTLTF